MGTRLGASTATAMEGDAAQQTKPTRLAAQSSGNRARLASRNRSTALAAAHARGDQVMGYQHLEASLRRSDIVAGLAPLTLSGAHAAAWPATMDKVALRSSR